MRLPSVPLQASPPTTRMLPMPTPKSPPLMAIASASASLKHVEWNGDTWYVWNGMAERDIWNGDITLTSTSKLELIAHHIGFVGAPRTIITHCTKVIVDAHFYPPLIGGGPTNQPHITITAGKPKGWGGKELAESARDMERSHVLFTD